MVGFAHGCKNEACEYSEYPCEYSEYPHVSTQSGFAHGCKNEPCEYAEYPL